MTEKAICVTKQSVDDLIGIIDQTLDLLKSKGSKQILSEEEYELLANAHSEKEIYTKVKNMMERKGSTTLCMMISDLSPAKKGTIKVISESEEDVDISEVSEPRRESEEPGTMGYF